MFRFLPAFHPGMLTLGLLAFFVDANAQPGALDTSFDPGVGASGSIQTIVLQPDGHILIAGSFTAYNGTARHGIARLNADGSLDNSFDPGTGVSGGAQPGIYSIALLTDGRMVVGGWFSGYNGTGRNNIALLNADGSLDPDLPSGSGTDSWVNAVTLQPDGRVLIAGAFSACNGTARAHIARLNSDGSLDTGFDPGTGASDQINSITLQGDGKALVCGHFTSYNGTTRNHVARLNSNGSLDTGFDPGTAANGFTDYIISTAVQPDGKVLVGGHFANFNGIARSGIVRLNADGSVDNSFDPGAGANSFGLQPIALQADGRMLIGGFFTSYDGTDREHIARLNSDGSLDTGFDPGFGTDGAINALAIQPDGRVLIGGSFSLYDGTSRLNIARVLGNGPSGITTIDGGSNALHLWPNPAQEMVQLSTPASGWILDAQGRVALAFARSNTVALDGLAPGCYLLRTSAGTIVRIAKQ